tara:strand:+ start:27173 stop:27598 length:426 start_codon:yes stop_codon:yes gene_type:complete
LKVDSVRTERLPNLNFWIYSLFVNSDERNILCWVGIAITALLAVYYQGNIREKQMFGITSLITALITYCLAPLIYLQPSWLVILIVVMVLWLTEQKESFLNFTKKFDDWEFVPLAKFLVIVSVILPLLPDKPISVIINISP